jgi:hypothetical protein
MTKKTTPAKKATGGKTASKPLKAAPKKSFADDEDLDLDDEDMDYDGDLDFDDDDDDDDDF